LKEDTVFTFGCFHPDYAEEIEYFRKCKVYSLQIEANLACPQGCLYCYASSTDKPMKELSSEDIIKVIDSALKMDIRMIDWLGGDPLLRSDWYELMSYAKSKNLKNTIWTSGIPLENIDVAKKAVEVTEGGFISVHLDSLDEEIYRKLHTGDPKRKVASILKGVDNVQSLGKNPEQMINCITFTKLVSEDADKTIKYFYDKKGMRTCLTQMCMEGLAEEHSDWEPTINDVKRVCLARDNINYPDSELSISSMDTNKFYCGGMICVTVDGEVTPCSVIRKGFGNIKTNPLEYIVKKHKKELLFAHLRDTKNLPGHCSSCEHNSVCWGCRATAYIETGDLFAEDPKCYINPKNKQ